MQTSDVEQLVRDQIENVDVNVESDGSHYKITAISDEFKDLNSVKRQQLIYGCINEHIINGTIHAVIIKAYTQDEWQEIA